MRLPRVEVGGWDLVGTAAADRVLVGAAVRAVATRRGRLPPGGRGARTGAPDTAALEALVGTPGVFGAWSLPRGRAPAPGMASTAGLALTVCYLDRPPVEVATDLAPGPGRPVGRTGSRTPLLAGPFERVVPGEWDRHLP